MSFLEMQSPATKTFFSQLHRGNLANSYQPKTRAFLRILELIAARSVQKQLRANIPQNGTQNL